MAAAAIAWMVLLPAGAWAEPTEPAIQVFVSIPPQAYLVQRVAGPHIEVGVLVGPGQNHHTFEPTPKQLADLASAQAYITIGLPFERRLVEKVRAANPGLAIIEAQAGITLRPIESAHADHDEGAFDPHVWLSPLNAKIIAANTCRALVRIDAANAAEYERSLSALEGDLDAAHARIVQMLAPVHGCTFYAYHPAFGYFADAYGLRQAAVEMEGKEPSARQLAELIARARADGVRVIFVQPQFPKKSAQTIAQEIGGTVVAIDPLSEDYIANIENIARKIRDGCGGK